MSSKLRQKLILAWFIVGLMCLLVGSYMLLGWGGFLLALGFWIIIGLMFNRVVVGPP